MAGREPTYYDAWSQKESQVCQGFVCQCVHMGMKTIIVTRHKALVKYLNEIGIAEVGTPVLTHVASPAEIEGAHVIGVLPLGLAAVCAKVTEIPLALTQEMRGKELGLEEVRAIAGAPVTYEVKVIKA